MKNIVAIDIGGTYVKHGVINELGEIIKIGENVPSSDNLKGFINTLINIVNKYKENYYIDGVSISTPGFVDYKKGVVNNCTAFRFIEKYPLKEKLQRVLEIPVIIENDANCVALAEKFTGNASECSDFICLTIGTGVGGGIFLNGNLIRGKEFKGGEFCYMITKDEEGYMTANQNSSMTALSNMYCDYKKLPKDTMVLGKKIFEEAENDEGLRKVIDNWYKNIARTIHNIASIVNPEKVLIGGGISARKDLLDKISKELYEIPSWKYVKCKLEICKHENNAGIIGAAYNYFHS